jgi:Tfp pilus assembly protein PilF
MGRIDEAVVHYQKALELNPNHVDAHNNLGILLANMGQADAAIAHFRKALETSPHAVRVLKNLGMALVQSGQVIDATSVFQNALALARSAGDEAQTKTIEQILGKLYETANAAGANATGQAP